MVIDGLERNVVKPILQIYVKTMASAKKSIVIRDIPWRVFISKSIKDANLVIFVHMAMSTMWKMI